MMKKLLVAVILAASLMMFSSATWAAAGVVVTYTETDMLNGWWKYDYNATNTSADWSIYGLTLYFVDETGADYETSLKDMTTPAGWMGDAALPKTTFATTFSLDPSTDIAPGGTLDNFTFQVGYRAGDLPYVLSFAKGYITDDLNGTSKMAPPPAVPVAPEPVSAVLFLFGVATLGVRGYLKSK